MADPLPDRRAFLKFGAATYSTALAAQRPYPIGTPIRRQAGSSQPNIILIYADDLGYGDLGSYGGELPTPNLDAMAQQGIRFEQFCSASPVCSPARAALLTGRYPTRVGVPDVLHPEDSRGLSLTESTLADTLKNVGYATMCIGKWHLGCQPEFMPNARGFDQFYGVPYSNDMPPLPLMSNTTVIEQPANLSMLTQRYTEQAVAFIARSRNMPFFLYMPHTYPHIPLAASQRFLGASGFGLYGDAVAEIDWSVGEVIRALQANGLDEKTLVMFSSDHGPWFAGSAGPLHGRKGETWEGGVRVPFLARFPGRIPAGRVSRHFASTLDILPTVASLCDAPLPAAPLDGNDIWPLLGQQHDIANREPFLYFDNWNLQCARLGNWKLHLARYNAPPWVPLPSGWRRNLPLMNPELYNLETDPSESYDVARANPQIVASIRASVERMLSAFPEPVPSLWRNTVQSAGVWCPAGGWPQT